MAIPFIRVKVSHIHEKAFKFEEPKDPYCLVILTQSFNHETQTYETNKVNLMDTNGQRSISSGAEEFHVKVDARVNDKYRRLQFLLLEQSIIYELLPPLKSNPLESKMPYEYHDILSQIEGYSTWQYEETLREFSLYCRSKDITISNGKFANMKNNAGETVKISLEVQLLNTGDAEAGNRHMKDNIWNDEEIDTQNLDKTNR